MGFTAVPFKPMRSLLRRKPAASALALVPAAALGGLASMNSPGPGRTVSPIKPTSPERGRRPARLSVISTSRPLASRLDGMQRAAETKPRAESQLRAEVG